MRVYAMLPTVLATSAMMASLQALHAQQPRIVQVRPGAVISPELRSFGVLSAAQPRAVIGVSTTGAATARDTLGVLVSEVRSGSPAEKAGIEEGNRIAAVNGVSLKLAAADVGDEQMTGVLSRRLSRELEKLKPGDEVDLRVYANGQMKTVKVKTIAPADLYSDATARRSDDRPTLGLNLAINGSARDSLGVFVMSVDDNGPAAKAGIQEGARIASINGVDLRSHDSPDDEMSLQSSNISRLEREVSRVKPGDEVELQVYYDGQTRPMKVKTGRMSDLSHHGRTFTIMGGDNFMPANVMSQLERLGPDVAVNMRRSLDTAVRGLTIGRLFGRMSW